MPKKAAENGEGRDEEESGRDWKRLLEKIGKAVGDGVAHVLIYDVIDRTDC